MRMLPTLLAAAACLAGCATPPPGQVPPVVYACEGGLVLRVQFAQHLAHVTLPGGEERVLPQQRSGSGIAYGTPDYQLRGKGNAATWTAGASKAVQCPVIPAVPLSARVPCSWPEASSGSAHQFRSREVP